MILYLAASFTTELVEPILQMGHKNVLFSYHYYADKTKLLKEWRKKHGITILMDSGAFSAYTAGVHIDIDKYITFLKDLKPKYYAVLDEIGDPDKTIYNQRYMESKGLLPLPTFHIGEPLKYLDHYLNDKRYKYMALGGMVGSKNLGDFLRNVWPIIYERRPDMKVHGFGLTTLEHMMPYPFYSIDSSSYLSPVRYGLMFEFKEHKRSIIARRIPERHTSKERNNELTIECAQHYINGTDFVNRYQKNLNFKYLLNQQTLW